MSRTLRLLAPLALFGCLPLAAAVVEMSASAEGRGAIAIQGQSLPVTRAEVSLIPGGRFIISFTGEERYAFRGEWQDQGSRIALTVQEAQGAAAEGSGELRLRGDRFRTIQINGANRTFSAGFTVSGAYKDFTGGATTSDVIRAPTAPAAPIVDKGAAVVSAPKAPAAPAGPSGPVASGAHPPKVTVQGAGTITQGRGERRTIDAMEVFLEADGRANLKGFGPQGETVLSGTWKDGGQSGAQHRFELTIVTGFGGQAAGRGFVLVAANGHIDQVSVQGASRGMRGGYTVEFRQR